MSSDLSASKIFGGAQQQQQYQYQQQQQPQSFFCSKGSPFFHERSCIFLGVNGEPVSLSAIDDRGLLPCHVCLPHDYDLLKAPFTVDLDALSHPSPTILSRFSQSSWENAIVGGAPSTSSNATTMGSSDNYRGNINNSQYSAPSTASSHSTQLRSPNAETEESEEDDMLEIHLSLNNDDRRGDEAIDGDEYEESHGVEENNTNNNGDDEDDNSVTDDNNNNHNNDAKDDRLFERFFHLERQEKKEDIADNDEKKKKKASGLVNCFSTNKPNEKQFSTMSSSTVITTVNNNNNNSTGNSGNNNNGGKFFSRTVPIPSIVPSSSNHFPENKESHHEDHSHHHHPLHQHATRPRLRIDTRAVVSEEGRLQRMNSAPHDAATITKTGALSPSRFCLAKEETDVRRIAMHVLQRILPPAEWSPPSGNAGKKFDLLEPSHLLLMCRYVVHLLQNEATVVKILAPCKVFGDIHGQMENLLDFFRVYGSPNHHTGDVTYVNYIFDGDFVDRGMHSLEVMALLLSLKITYPNRVCLLRGNHEDSALNCNYGFKDECTSRISALGSGGGVGEAVWREMNSVFEMLPLAAVVENSIFVCHGGIGGNVKKIEQIEALQRPINIEAIPEGSMEFALVMDILWSDPTPSDAVEGVHDNPERGEGVMKYGPDRVKEFCTANSIEMIIRAHECVEAGYEFFAGGQLITVFSATTYCGQHDNAGAMLIIDRDLNIQPRVITGSRSVWLQKQYRPPSPMRTRPPHRPIPESPKHFLSGMDSKSLADLAAVYARAFATATPSSSSTSIMIPCSPSVSSTSSSSLSPALPVSSSGFLSSSSAFSSSLREEDVSLKNGGSNDTKASSSRSISLVGNSSSSSNNGNRGSVFTSSLTSPTGSSLSLASSSSAVKPPSIPSLTPSSVFSSSSMVGQKLKLDAFDKSDDIHSNGRSNNNNSFSAISSSLSPRSSPTIASSTTSSHSPILLSSSSPTGSISTLSSSFSRLSPRFSLGKKISTSDSK